MLNQTAYAHIVLDDQDVPYLAGTDTKVIEAYYWDHQEELDEDIQRRLEYVEQIRSASEPTPLVKKLRAQGLLP